MMNELIDLLMMTDLDAWLKLTEFMMMYDVECEMP
jgi:hypothetical protein